MKRFVLALLVLAPTMAVAQQRVVLAVFAHPDDETFVAPILARYAREGVKVYLAIATQGEKGTNERAGIPAGEALAKVRHGEAECSAQKLGIQPPFFFELNDGELGAMTNPLGKNIKDVATNTQKLIEQLHPQVLVTWGPEGGYGHPDHRLVSDAVTQVVQASPKGVKLYYAGLTPKQAAPLNRIWPESIQWLTVNPDFVTANVSYEKSDKEKANQALQCHKSQFSPEAAHKIGEALDAGWAGQVSFRAWSGGLVVTDLFQ